VAAERSLCGLFLYPGGHQMTKTLFVLLITAFLLVSIAAQSITTMEEDYRQWVTENSSKSFYFGARLKRDSANSAVLKLGFNSIEGPYKVIVTPLVFLRDKDGKVTETKDLDPTTLSTTGEFKKDDFHSPVVIFRAESEVNGVRIELKHRTAKPRITLVLSPTKESRGLITSK